MKKHTSEEAQSARMRNLAGVKETSVNESKNYTLGTLIDFERAADGVAYGIIKEQHKYYIKKGGLNENQNVTDFVYIGGLGNVTDFQYTKLAEAKKNRNFLLQTLNEGNTAKVDPSGSITKKTLNEDKVSQEIQGAEAEMGELEAATAAAKQPEVAPEDEMQAGLETEPETEVAPETEPETEVSAEDGISAGDEALGGEVSAEELGLDATEEVPAEAGAEGNTDTDGIDMDSLDVSGEEGGGAEAGAEDAEEKEQLSALQSDVQKIAGEIKNTELDDGELTWLLKSFVRGFIPDADEEGNSDANKMIKIKDADRQEVSKWILDVVPEAEKDMEGLGQNVEDTTTEVDPTEPTPEPGIAEQQCAECGGFAQYAESRGYTAESIMECGEEEMTNMISGYANAHEEGQNDGDFKAIAILITPEIIEKLKGEYGHDDFANQVEPFSTEMNEAQLAEKQVKVNEMFGVNEEEGIPVDSVEVQPMMEEEAIEEDVNIKVVEKQGKKLSAEKAPEVEMKEADEKEGEIIDDIDVAGPAEVEDEEIPAEVAGEEEPLDLTKREEPEMPIISGVDSMGGGVVKPEGAEITTVEVTKDSVKVELSESETKLRKYIRNRLQEHAGVKKPTLNESKKSPTLAKLDRIIDKQFGLHESKAKKKVNETINEAFGMGVAEKFAKLNPQDVAGVDALFQKAFSVILANPKMKAISRAVQTTPPDVKYGILQQYVDGGGGTLRLGDSPNIVRYETDAARNAAVPQPFGGGGTLGKTAYGGVTG